MNPISEPDFWQNRSPGDLDDLLPGVQRTPVEPALFAAARAFPHWSGISRQERGKALRRAQELLRAAADPLALGIAREVGKPITEAKGEVGAVIAKVDLTLQDAEEHLPDRTVTGGPHPAAVRRRALGPAVVVGPFNFPLHLGNGAILAHLAAGNTVIYKPSPLGASVAGQYAELLQQALPEGVFSCVQGGGETGLALCGDPRVRAVCFTGSVAAGRALARMGAEDLGKEMALELGGRNAALVCADADLDLAAAAVAEAACLTAGQRCNATARVLVDRGVATAFLEKLEAALALFVPGNPLLPGTKLGPVINAKAVERYVRLLETWGGDPIVPGGIAGLADGKRGHYVKPAVRRWKRFEDSPEAIAACEETFVPVLSVVETDDLDASVRAHNALPLGLTASVFTRSEETFRRLADRLHAGNIYANLPTTFSPSTLPFGGWGDSGNHHPGGKGFIRFTTGEQAVQWRADGFAASKSSRP
jgi:succinylglutamic semialdehyde dehydrogenase